MLLDRGLELWVVPVANIEGRELAEIVRPCQRGTADNPREATDLNRNFPVDWTPGAEFNAENLESITYGTGPFSAYQSRILAEIAQQRNWSAFVDVHSGELSFNLPFGHRAGGAPEQEEQMHAIEAAQALCPGCKAGPARDVLGYDLPGQLMDWMYLERGVKYSYMWEIYSPQGILCTSHFNPIDRTAFSDSLQRWSLALAALGEYVLDKGSPELMTNH